MTAGSHALPEASPVPYEGPARVLVAGDHDLIRGGLAALIRAAPGLEVAGEAVNGLEAVAQAARVVPDVVLMDMQMPELDGAEACTRILAAAPADSRPRVLALTTFDLDEYVHAALRAGALGLLLKDTGPERLLSALHLTADGDCLFAPSVRRRLVETYTRAGRPPRGGPPAAVGGSLDSEAGKAGKGRRLNPGVSPRPPGRPPSPGRPGAARRGCRGPASPTCPATPPPGGAPRCRAGPRGSPPGGTRGSPGPGRTSR